MKRLIRYPGVAAALAITITTAFIITSLYGEEAAEAPASPKIIAVKFHADW